MPDRTTGASPAGERSRDAFQARGVLAAVRRSSPAERALWLAIAGIAAIRLRQAIPFGGDLRIIYWAGQHLLTGQPVFADPYFIYLPSSALFAAPFGWLPEAVAVGIGATLGCVAVIVFAWSAVRLLAPQLPSWVAPAVVLGVLVSHVGGDLITVANSEFVTLAVLPLLLRWGADGRWLQFGVLLGISIAVKPFLIALLAVLLLARQVRALALAIGIPVALSLLVLPFTADPGGFFGVTIPNLIQGQSVLNNPANASLANLLPTLGVPPVVTLAVRGLLVVVGLTAAFFRWRAARATASVVTVVEVGTILLLTSSLASSVVWSHYSLLALPVFVVAAHPGAVTRRIWVIWPLLLPMFALGYPAVVPGVWGSVSFRVGASLALILLLLSLGALQTAWRARTAVDDGSEPAVGGARPDHPGTRTRATPAPAAARHTVDHAG